MNLLSPADVRMVGLVDSDHIEDRTRNREADPIWEKPVDLLQPATQQFRPPLALLTYACEVNVD